MARSARSAVPAAALAFALALALVGCDGGGGSPSPSPSALSVTPSPVAASPTAEITEQPLRDTTTEQPVREATTDPPVRAAFPAELVGAWAGGQETQGRHLTFTADGRFDAESYRGTAVVQGATMIWKVDGQASRVIPWTLSGGVLKVGNSTYLRDDQRTGGEISLVGAWININGYSNLEFGSDGSFELDDQANDVVTVGSYVLRGNRLTLSSRTKPTTTYIIALDTFLTFSSTSGQVLGEYTRAG